jgi:SAM-dependent methyltransferase
VRGYDDRSYGEAFADVYDEWYLGVSDIDATVALLGELVTDAGGGPVLELGIGTGRLALPLAATGVVVHGVDSSPAMLDLLAAKDGADQVRTWVGDMVDDLGIDTYGVVFVAYNTLFNLRSAERQQACFRTVAQRLRPRGSFLVEAFVPDERDGEAVDIRTMTADRVVLSISRHRAADQVAEGQFVELTETHGVRLRPWAIRYASPQELDAMAAAADLTLAARWEDVARAPFTDDSVRHVSVYRRP